MSDPVGTCRAARPGAAGPAQQQPYGPNPDSKSLRQHYVEGRLDIARVIYKTDLWSACGIVPARLVYEDSQGERHTVEYKAWGSGCSGN